MALDVLVLDLAEACGEQVAGRREALDVLVERHEVPLALLEDHAHLLGREQIQILERVQIFRALRGATGDASRAIDPARRGVDGVSTYDATSTPAPLDTHARRSFKNGRCSEYVAEELAAFR